MTTRTSPGKRLSNLGIRAHPAHPDVAPELADPRRHELIRKLAAVVPYVDSITRTMLWLADIDRLEFLARQSEWVIMGALMGDRNTRAVLAYFPEEDSERDPSECFNHFREWELGTGFYEKSERRRELCVTRDQHCIITKEHSPLELEGVNIYPVNMSLRPQFQQNNFWWTLETFCNAEELNSWRIAASNLKRAEDLPKPTLPEPRRAYVAGPDNTEIALLLAPKSNIYSKLDTLAEGPSFPATLDWPSTRTVSGDIITMTTAGPEEYPLPSLELLQMQWFLIRVLGMSGAAEIETQELLALYSHEDLEKVYTDSGADV
ncbi:hypothetical protein BDW74DRAFT_179410 [Aspergillus multicolor]|uniref:uncharacterized protein n=1 Tax=Aspergillus multicolor TaxID=41759 RepID=UPI003CCCEF26